MKPQINGQQKRFFGITVVFLMGMVLLWCAGCAKGDGVPRNLEADYGRSVTSNKLEMMVTPPNVVDTRPAVGMTPTAAANAQQKYDQSFTPAKEPETRLIIRQSQ
jgi:hypothetical protein